MRKHAWVLMGMLACGGESGAAEPLDGGRPDAELPDGQSTPIPRAVCESEGGDADVSAPELLVTLFDRWHEAWLGSPAVADLDADGVPEILVPRHDRLLAWHADGSLLFEAPTEGRIWASPVVADLDPAREGLEVAVAARARIYAWDASGGALPGF